MHEQAQPILAAVSPRLFRAVALANFVANALAALALTVAQLLAPSAAGGVLLAGVLLAASTSLGTVYLLPRRPLTVAALPLITAVLLVIALFGLVFPPFTGVATVAVLLPVLFAALTGSRRLTSFLAGAAVLVALAITPLASALGLAFQGGPLLNQLLFTGPATIVGLSWFAIDQLIRARDEAIALAEGRAAEAEQARATAEQARAEAVARSEEQDRLLGLVQTLELPVLGLGPGVLAVPLIGALDSRRLEAIRAAVLEAVDRERAHAVVFDLTGIADVDTSVAHDLIATARAVRLLGAAPLVSGVRPAVAHALAGLGVSLDGFRAATNLQEALALAQGR